MTVDCPVTGQKLVMRSLKAAEHTRTVDISRLQNFGEVMEWTDIKRLRARSRT